MDIKRFYKMLTVLVVLFYAGMASAGVLEDREYLYDNAGNITGVIDRVNGGQAFQYDEQNRLVGASGDTYNENYSYTVTGNMTGKGGKRYTYPSPGQRHPHAPTSDGVYNYTYDKKGNLKTKTKYDDSERWEYFYDYESHLEKVVKKELVDNIVVSEVVMGEYWYDNVGQMIKKLEDGHETLYFFNGMYEERDGVPYTFYYANGERVAERVGTGPDSKLYYYHNDHLGGTNIITDEGGNVVKEVQYFPFGKTRRETGIKEAPYKFTGKEFSSSTGLYYYGARWYDPDLGRFISPDPAFSPDLAAKIGAGAGGNGDMKAYLGNPQRQNRYSYALNNPLLYVDPDGRLPVNNLLYDRKGHFTSGMSLSRTLDDGVTRPHKGVDMGADGNPNNVPIMAARNGIVKVVNPSWSGYGYGVVIFHPDTMLATFYAHLRDEPTLKINQPIKEGDFVGIMGRSGRTQGGPVLHYEIRIAINGGDNLLNDYLSLPLIDPGNPTTGYVNIGEYNSQYEIPDPSSCEIPNHPLSEIPYEEYY